MFNLGKTKSLIGLDIGSSCVKAVELKKSKTGYELVSYGLEPLAQDTVVDGAIMDAPSVAEKIIAIFDGQKIKTKDVATSVSGHSVIVKRVQHASDDGGRAVRQDSNRSEPAHTIRYRRREPKLPASGSHRESDGRSSRGREKRQDSEPHERAGAGGEDAGGSRYRCVRSSELLRSELRAGPVPGGRAC